MYKHSEAFLRTIRPKRAAGDPHGRPEDYEGERARHDGGQTRWGWDMQGPGHVLGVVQGNPIVEFGCRPRRSEPEPGTRSRGASQQSSSAVVVAFPGGARKGGGRRGPGTTQVLVTSGIWWVFLH